MLRSREVPIPGNSSRNSKHRELVGHQVSGCRVSDGQSAVRIRRRATDRHRLLLLWSIEIEQFDHALCARRSDTPTLGRCAYVMATLRWCFAVVEFDEAMISDCWAKHRRRKPKNEWKHPPAYPPRRISSPGPSVPSPCPSPIGMGEGEVANELKHPPAHPPRRIGSPGSVDC